MTLKINLLEFQKSLSVNVKLVVVSKTHPAESILELYQAGHRVFGENKAQELVNKAQKLPAEIEWHFIGHLQSNKVKQIVPYVTMVHSIDSIRLLSEINSEAKKIDRVINCLLQFHIATEETKFGLDLKEAEFILSSSDFGEMQNVRISGVMGMATFSENHDLVRQEFRNLRNIFSGLKEKYFREKAYFNEISMGMSGDYQIAMEEGSTLIRIGTAIFGERNYNQQ